MVKEDHRFHPVSRGQHLTRISRRGLPSPPDAHERQALPGQSELQMSFAALHQDPRRRGEELQLSGALQLIVLLRGRRLRESHLLPSREGIAVMPVNAEMFDMREVHGFGQPSDHQVVRRSRGIHVLVVIVPDHDFDFVIRARGNGADIRLLPHSCADDLPARKRTRARNLYAFAAQQPEHPEGIEHRFVYSIGGQLAKSFEVGLVFELEGPAYRACKTNLLAGRQCVGGVHRLGRVGGIQGAIAVSILGIAAC